MLEFFFCVICPAICIGGTVSGPCWLNVFRLCVCHVDFGLLPEILRRTLNFVHACMAASVQLLHLHYMCAVGASAARDTQKVRGLRWICSWLSDSVFASQASSRMFAQSSGQLFTRQQATDSKITNMLQ